MGLDGIWQRLRWFARRDAIEREMDEEMRFHLEQQVERNLARGMTPGEARRQARLRFGGVEQCKERARDEVRPALVEDLWRDLRYGARLLVRAPGFAAVSILTLGLGIGAATAVFSVVDGVLLRPLPYPDADRIVRLFQVDANGRRMNVSEPNFTDWKAEVRSIPSMAEMVANTVPVAAGDERTMTPGAWVSREFFDVMRVRPALGRPFLADELHTGARPAVIVSHNLWQTRFGGAPLDAGLTLRIQEVVHHVVGVMPAGFDYPSASQFWVPRELDPPQTSRTAHNFRVVARLAEGVTLDAARAELSAVSRALKARHGDGTWMADAAAVPLLEQITASARPALWLLFAASALLLLIACLNVSNLQLARAATRGRELALRLALGASRGRVVRQMLAEALVLTMASSLLGLLLAWAGVRALVAMRPDRLPRLDAVSVDAGVLVFALLVASVTAAALGLATALRASQRDIRETLSDAPRTATGARSQRVRHVLVVAQVALTIVLLAGVGLLARSFLRLLAIDPGFRTDDALVLDLTWPFERDRLVGERRAGAQARMLERVRALPGVQDAGLVSDFPIGPGWFSDGQFIEMTSPDEIRSIEDFAKLGDAAKSRIGHAGYRVASGGYFTAMGIPLRRGRLFDDTDGPDAPHVAVISESLAKAKWPGQDPIGRFVQFGNMDGDLRGFRIVGVVGDVRESTPESPPEPVFYGHYRQRLASSVSLVLRAEPRVSPASLADAARQLARETDPAVTVESRTVATALDRALAGRRDGLALVTVFALLALTLTTMGVYGLVAFLVAQRRREIGIRMALGAESGDIVRLVVGAGMGLAAAGIVVGLGAALVSTRLLEGMLFGVAAIDPLSLATVIGVTLGVTVLASYVPARRAVRVSPVTALGGE